MEAVPVYEGGSGSDRMVEVVESLADGPRGRPARSGQGMRVWAEAHETPAGNRNGLLLPPNGSYSFSRSFCAGRPDPNLFADTLMHADIQFVEPGVPDPRLSKIARNAGSFTVLLPLASTTTTGVPSA